MMEQVGHLMKTKSFKFLGHYVNDKLDWDDHISNVIRKTNSEIYALSRAKNFLPVSAKIKIYNSLVKSYLDYASIAYGTACKMFLDKLYINQKRALINVLNTKYNAHIQPVQIKLKQLRLYDIIKYNNLIFMHELRYGKLPSSFINILSMRSDEGATIGRHD